MDGDKKFKVIFEPGAFDGFDGTQEELDEFIAELTRLAESGELFDEMVKQGLSLDELDDETQERIIGEMHGGANRVLH